MSVSDRFSAVKRFRMPEDFTFGLEERPPRLKPIKLKLDDSSGCNHEWYERDKLAQTLRHEGKTILECRSCKRTVAVYDWKLQPQGR